MANKKINQLVAKTTIQSTDLFPLGDATTGQLFKKTIADLQAAIGGAVISVNGLTGALVLDTDDIQELASPTNRYFTEARARAAISLTTTGSSGASTYSSSTGVLNVPTYTLAGLGGITASFLSGGTGITYNSGTGVISYSGTVYTDASIRALFSAGTGLSYNSSTGAFTNTAPDQTVAIAGGTGISVTGTYPSFTVAFTGTIYTDSSIRGLFSGTAPITFNASTGTIGITQATTSTDGYLSSSDWNTFNSKQGTITLTTTGTSGASTFSSGTLNIPQYQGAITLTTTGTSGAATFSGGTLNIPQYQSVLTNPVTGTGTSGYVAYWNGSNSITGEAALYYDSTNDRLGIGTTTPFEKLSIIGGDVSISSTRRIYLDAGSGYLYLTSSANNGSMQFYTGDTERISINSNGNTNFKGALNHLFNDGGINLYKNDGTTIKAYLGNPDGSNSDEGSLYLYKANSTKVQIRANGTSFFNGGSLGIGESNPSSYWSAANKVVIYKAGGENGMTFVGDTNHTATIAFAYGISGADRYRGYIQFYHSNNNMYFGNSGTDRMIIAGSGNILMGTSTDNGERLYVSGSIRATGSITANSDARLKKNIERIENALEKVEQISGYTYNTIYDEDRHAGVIAQEIDKVLPEIVNKGNDGLMGVEYGNISALLIEAIKEQKGIIDNLQARLSALEK